MRYHFQFVNSHWGGGTYIGWGRIPTLDEVGSTYLGWQGGTYLGWGGGTYL